MSVQLDIVCKLREALETGNPNVATPFVAIDCTRQALPARYVLSGVSAPSWERNWY